MSESEVPPQPPEEKPSEEQPVEEKPGEEKQKAGAHFEETWQPRLWSRLIVLLLIVAYGIGLVVANSSQVPINFLFVSVHVSKVWLILICIAIGLVGGVLLSQMYRRRSEREKTTKAEPGE
jgi:uncharacterized integral membrane protein